MSCNPRWNQTELTWIGAWEQSKAGVRGPAAKGSKSCLCSSPLCKISEAASAPALVFKDARSRVWRVMARHSFGNPFVIRSGAIQQKSTKFHLKQINKQAGGRVSVAGAPADDARPRFWNPRLLKHFLPGNAFYVIPAVSLCWCLTQDRGTKLQILYFCRK